MNTYTGQMEATAGNGSQSVQLQGNAKKGLMPIAALTLFVLALSIVFPYGIGVAVLAWVIALTGALVGAGYATYLLLKESFSKTVIFGYSPVAAYLAGKKTKNAGKSGQA
jgi:hypothetical protein